MFWLFHGRQDMATRSNWPGSWQRMDGYKPEVYYNISQLTCIQIKKWITGNGMVSVISCNSGFPLFSYKLPVHLRIFIVFQIFVYESPSSHQNYFEIRHWSSDIIYGIHLTFYITKNCPDLPNWKIGLIFLDLWDLWGNKTRENTEFKRESLFQILEYLLI